MIESRLDPSVDGTGGGYGNYPGLTVAQIAERFRALASEGHHRSVRAILRIVHEQTAARGTLGAQRYLAVMGIIVTLGLAGLRLFASQESWGRFNLYLGASVTVTILFVLGALSIERTVRRNSAQVREIRRLALIALEQVLNSPGFNAKALEREHLRSLGELRKSDPGLWEKVSRALNIA